MRVFIYFSCHCCQNLSKCVDMGLGGHMSGYSPVENTDELRLLEHPPMPQTNKFPLRAERFWDFSPAQSSIRM